MPQPHPIVPTPDRPSRSGRRRAAGFTLVEILIVVGIIALLVSIAVIGFRVVGGVTKSRANAVMMENCKGFLNAYELTRKIDNLLDSSTVSAMATTPAADPRWASPLNSSEPTYTVVNCRVCTPKYNSVSGYVEPSDAQRAVSERYLRDETARVLQALMSVPENRRAIEAMSADRVVKVQYPGDPSTTVVPAGDPANYPAGTVGLVDGVQLIDANGKPIYFIPGGGIMNVMIGYNGSGDKNDPNSYGRVMTVRAVDHRPFWASPGPDGDLSTGDDNEYSTEVVAK